jgi:hypothetical protein
MDVFNYLVRMTYLVKMEKTTLISHGMHFGVSEVWHCCHFFWDVIIILKSSPL